MTLSYEAL